jgi:molecular chaperone GrpE
MAPDNQNKDNWNIPVKFLDSDSEDSTSGDDHEPGSDSDITTGRRNFDSDEDSEPQFDERNQAVDDTVRTEGGQERTTGELGGPLVAELVATRAELKRVEGENQELRERMARRQADFENYRKRTERERAETYNRVVADIATKLLPVLDNLKRALDAEASVEASESDEFRHFLSGVDLIFKQLNGVLEALGVKPITSIGEQFNPHIHEAVVTEPTDEYEPDTVVQEIVTGYRLGDKLIRPAMVKVAVRK